jgi:hypothetical protein
MMFEYESVYMLIADVDLKFLVLFMFSSYLLISMLYFAITSAFTKKSSPVTLFYDKNQLPRTRLLEIERAKTRKPADPIDVEVLVIADPHTTLGNPNTNASKQPEELSDEEYGRFFVSYPIDTMEELLAMQPCPYSRSMLEGWKPPSAPDNSISGRLLLCHDMKGNYLDDSYIYGTSLDLQNSFQVMHWEVVDIFVYFSHHLVTIPPLSWINVCHRHHKSVLGTFITEWKEGSTLWTEILQDDEQIVRLVQSLVQLMIVYGFDGWLINIEHSIAEELAYLLIPKLVYFLAELRRQCQAHRPHAQVIWYDAICSDGQLLWQNALTPLNQSFFDASDSMFVNYTWNHAELNESRRQLVKNDPSGHSATDLFFGCDIFGRSSAHGSGFETYKSVDLLIKAGVSVALFAPGWVTETILSSSAVSASSAAADDDRRPADTVHALTRHLEAYKQLFDPILERWRLRELAMPSSSSPTMMSATQPRDLLPALPLHFSFNTAMGLFVFFLGQRYPHPSARWLLHEEDDRVIAEAHGSYYDLNLMEMHSSASMLLKSYPALLHHLQPSANTAAATTTSYVRSAWNLYSGYMGSSSLQLSGVLSTSQRCLASIILIPIFSIAYQSIVHIPSWLSTCYQPSSSTRKKLPPRRSVNNRMRIQRIGKSGDPITIRVSVALQQDSEVALLLTFRQGFNHQRAASAGKASASNKQELQEKYQILLLPQATHSSAPPSPSRRKKRYLIATSTKDELTWAQPDAVSSQSPSAAGHKLQLDSLEEDQPWENFAGRSAYRFYPSLVNSTTAPATAKLPDEAKIRAYLQRRRESALTADVDENESEHVQDLIDNNDPELMIDVPWMERCYYLNPVHLRDLASRDLLSIEVVAYPRSTARPTSTSTSTMVAYRALIGSLHIDAGVDALPLSLLRKRSEIVLKRSPPLSSASPTASPQHQQQSQQQQVVAESPSAYDATVWVDLDDEDVAEPEDDAAAKEAEVTVTSYRCGTVRYNRQVDRYAVYLDAHEIIRRGSEDLLHALDSFRSMHIFRCHPSDARSERAHDLITQLSAGRIDRRLHDQIVCLLPSPQSVDTASSSAFASYPASPSRLGDGELGFDYTRGDAVSALLRMQLLLTSRSSAAWIELSAMDVIVPASSSSDEEAEDEDEEVDRAEEEGFVLLRVCIEDKHLNLRSYWLKVII